MTSTWLPQMLVANIQASLHWPELAAQMIKACRTQREGWEFESPSSATFLAHKIYTRKCWFKVNATEGYTWYVLDIFFSLIRSLKCFNNFRTAAQETIPCFSFKFKRIRFVLFCKNEAWAKLNRKKFWVHHFEMRLGLSLVVTGWIICFAVTGSILSFFYQLFFYSTCFCCSELWINCVKFLKLQLKASEKNSPTNFFRWVFWVNMTNNWRS